MINNSLKSSLALCFFALMLSGCLGGGITTLKTPFVSVKTSEPKGLYEGKWVGSLLRTSGNDRCRTKRLGISFELNRDTFVGDVKRDDRTHFLYGNIAEDGTIISATIGGYYDQEDISLVGKFEADAIAGTWSSKHCQGSWTADRIE